ncbi:MAG: RNA 2',3'-cyclic phosphodiesterase [Phycisphaerae bacterium]|jgi:2'-5' RNA ligase
MRTFIAVVPEKQIIKKLDDVQKQLRLEMAGHRKDTSWPRPEQAHITLAFLGDVPEEKLESVCGTVENAVRGLRSFMINVQGTGFFGKNAHTFFATVTEGAGELGKLRWKVSEPLAKKEFFAPSKKFEPHITLLRLKSAKPGRLVKNINYSMSRQPFGKTRVQSVCVFTSELTKTGPEYTCIAEYFLD